VTWLLQSLLVVFSIGLIIVLQPELRRLITTLGEQPFLKAFFPHSLAHVREIVEASRFLSEQGWGGLIVLERETSLVGFGESGVRIDADIKAELLGPFSPPGRRCMTGPRSSARPDFPRRGVRCRFPR